jgi:phosphoglycerate dehydrogenase-like enzyme
MVKDLFVNGAKLPGLRLMGFGRFESFEYAPAPARPMKRNVLVGVPYADAKGLDALTPCAELYWLDRLSEQELQDLLPKVDCLYVQRWPRVLDAEKVSRMSRLAFVQSDLAGVNQIPFAILKESVVVSSNAGAYSDEVGEFAWALLLAGAKKVVKFDRAMQQARITGMTSSEQGREVKVLRDKTLGIAGYGGIGRSVSAFGRAFGMKILVYSRSDPQENVESFQGREGLRHMLERCDALVLALPLTKLTRNIIGAPELASMKTDAILVNVARGELVDQEALYQHLRRNKDFIYATDVWWHRDGRESFPPELPLQELENFIGTPHASGPSATVGNGPLRHSAENILRFLRGEKPVNVVDRKEYV